MSQGWLIKRTVQNEPFVTKFPFILTNLGIWKSKDKLAKLILSIRQTVLHTNDRL
jgi:hypothetical protein